MRIQQLAIRVVGTPTHDTWFTHAGIELDLLLKVRGRRWGVEIKYADAPGMTKSMRIALAELKLDRMFVVYPGETAYELDRRVTVLPLAHLLTELRKSLGQKA